MSDLITPGQKGQPDFPSHRVTNQKGAVSPGVLRPVSRPRSAHRCCSVGTDQGSDRDSATTGRWVSLASSVKWAQSLLSTVRGSSGATRRVVPQGAENLV